MSNILRKIVNDILPVNMKDKTNQHIPLKLLPCEVLDKCLKNLFSKGWIDMQSVYTLEQLLNLCGGDWFSDRTVMVRDYKMYNFMNNFIKKKLSICI